MYAEVAQAAQDQDLRARIAGCLTMVGHTSPHPMQHAEQIQWAICGSGTIAEAYAYAVATNVPRPGNDTGVITDTAILVAVTEILGE